MSPVRTLPGLFFGLLAGCFGLSVGWAQSPVVAPQAAPVESTASEVSVSAVRGIGQPEWFQPGWRQVGKVEFLDVSVEGQATRALAEKELLEQLRRAILEQMGFDRPEDPQVLPELSRRFIREQLLVPQRLLLFPYEDELTREAARLEGRMPLPYYRGYAEARITPELRTLVERWRQLPALRDSLKWLGLGALGILGSIAILFGYLKAEHLSHSHYTRRLQTIALIALATLAGLIIWLV